MGKTPMDDAAWEAKQDARIRKIITVQIVLILIALAALITGVVFTVDAVERYEKDLQQAKVECEEAGGVLIDWVCFNQTVVIRP